jgi:IS1 family transposase
MRMPPYWNWMNYGHLCGSKTHQAWIWIALCRKTRQVVAYAVGDRSEKTCRHLWEAIAATYRAGHCYTDFWAAYQAVIPEEQHSAVGKESGETARAGTLEQYPATASGSRM